MTNNDILRRIRYTFDLSDSQMIAIFNQADHEVTREEISDWLKKDDDPALLYALTTAVASRAEDDKMENIMKLSKKVPIPIAVGKAIKSTLIKRLEAK